jgi:hypothetical protein
LKKLTLGGDDGAWWWRWLGGGRAEVATRLLSFVHVLNELKWCGEERKGNARFPNLAYICQLTDEYWRAHSGSLAPRLTDEYMPCDR